MPHKYYHGRTGQIWNVTPHAVGVEVNKRVRNRIIVKRLHVRIDHIRPSRCQEDFLKRKREIPKLRAEAKKAKKPLPSLKRQPVGPKPGRFVTNNQVQTITPVKYEDLF